MEFFNLDVKNELAAAYHDYKKLADEAYADGKKLKARRLYRKYMKSSFEARGIYDKI